MLRPNYSVTTSRRAIVAPIGLSRTCKVQAGAKFPTVRADLTRWWAVATQRAQVSHASPSVWIGPLSSRETDQARAAQALQMAATT